MNGKFTYKCNTAPQIKIWKCLYVQKQPVTVFFNIIIIKVRTAPKIRPKAEGNKFNQLFT